MPHIEIKCFPGRTEEQKALLANKLAEDAITDAHHVKPAKLPASRKSNETVPLS